MVAAAYKAGKIAVQTGKKLRTLRNTYAKIAAKAKKVLPGGIPITKHGDSIGNSAVKGGLKSTDEIADTSKQLDKVLDDIPCVSYNMPRQRNVIDFLLSLVESTAYASTPCDKMKKKQAVLEHGGKATPPVNNMDEFFQGSFGGTFKNSSTATSKVQQGQTVYRIENKIPGNPVLKKGDQVYLDASHKDHLEVFNSRGKAKSVLNLDGTVNHKKANKAIKEGRTI